MRRRSTELPQELKFAVEQELGAVQAASLRAASAALSARYREGKPSRFGSREDIEAYAALRMPATFAAVFSALRETALCMPGFSPRTLLDAGAGPGTASWAAAEVWPDIQSILSIERDASMAALGRRLASRSAHPALRGGVWHTADLAGALPQGEADVAVLSYSFGELPREQRAKLLGRLWEKTAGALILIEPGTPDGFERVRWAREFLRTCGASIIAPCPGDVPCPMGEGNWCHFSARVARSRMHRLAKDAELAYEDEKFSYIAAAKAETIPCAGRVLRHPQTRKGHVILNLCTREGAVNPVVPRSRAGAYRLARDLRWGDAIRHSEIDLF